MVPHYTFPYAARTAIRIFRIESEWNGINKTIWNGICFLRLRFINAQCCPSLENWKLRKSINDRTSTNYGFSFIRRCSHSFQFIQILNFVLGFGQCFRSCFHFFFSLLAYTNVLWFSDLIAFVHICGLCAQLQKCGQHKKKLYAVCFPVHEIVR